MRFTRTTKKTPAATVVVPFSLLLSASLADEKTNICKLYLAKSTIPNAGLGVFTGVDLSIDDTIG
jgi:hypothetical protein